MKNELYYITCLTNLHVGSGDVNYNIVDKEVEKDPITNYPIIHASGIKGALRDACAGDDEYKKIIFGVPGNDEYKASDSSGQVKFVNAHLLYRPLRARGDIPCVNVTTLDILNSFFDLTENFGITGLRVDLSKIDFGENNFLASKGGIMVEGEATGVLKEDTVNALKSLLGEDFAIARSFDDFDLPVIARNNLSDNRNLWYEEYVPHGSRFYFLVMQPDELNYKLNSQIQIGGNSSIGYGYCKFERFEGGKADE